MRIALAYISVVLLWATTPLAIKWSGEGPGFLFAVTSRMTIGFFCLILALAVFRQSVAWHRRALLTYLAVALQIYGSMMFVYWSSQYIPSGWVSVIFGLAPLMTALLAGLFLHERELSLVKLIAYLIGVGGLYVMFGSALHFGEHAVPGIVGVLIATFLQSVGAVWIKRINARLPALSQVSGGLAIALPLYLITWHVLDGNWPLHLSRQNLFSIAYLGMIATTFGFFLYYYLLTHLSATRVALISLTTPVMALILGHLVNREPLSQQTILGSSLILTALLTHEIIGRIRFGRLFRSKKL